MELSQTIDTFRDAYRNDHKRPIEYLWMLPGPMSGLGPRNYEISSEDI